MRLDGPCDGTFRSSVRGSESVVLMMVVMTTMRKQNGREKRVVDRPCSCRYVGRERERDMGRVRDGDRDSGVS